MKATELMIGDWVSCVDSTHQERTFARIDAIEEGQTCILVRKDNVNWFLDIGLLQPISLTAEILEENGFEEGEFHTYKYRDYDDFFYVTIIDGQVCSMEYTKMIFNPEDVSEIDHSSVFEFGREKVYVHTLQHALRLCGIDKEIVL